jgi:DNA polymerase III epsilon subunit-like protein
MANPSYYVALDTETGDLNPESGDLLTLYMAIVDQDFKILDELDLKLKPNDGRLPIANAGALKVNGINLQQHFEDPETITYDEGKTKIVAMLKKYLKKTGRYSNLRVLGYNVPFDIKWIQHHVLPFAEYDSLINYNIVDPKMVVNFLKDCQWFPPDLGTLVSVVKHFDIPMHGNAHNAKTDTLATIEVYKKLLKLMASKKDGGGQGVYLIDMLEA